MRITWLSLEAVTSLCRQGTTSTAAFIMLSVARELSLPEIAFIPIARGHRHTRHLQLPITYCRPLLGCRPRYLWGTEALMFPRAAIYYSVRSLIRSFYLKVLTTLSGIRLTFRPTLRPILSMYHR